MQISALFTSPVEVAADWLVVPIFEDDAPLPTGAAAIDCALRGAIGRLRQTHDITGKNNELTPLLDATGIAARRVLVVGLGKPKEADRISLLSTVASAARSMTTKQLDRLALVLPDNIAGMSSEAVAVTCGIGLAQGSQGPGMRKSKVERFMPREFCLVAPNGSGDEVQRGARRAAILGQAVALARELVNTPACDLYPETFAERARQIATAAGLEYAVLDQQQIEAERMGSLLGVAMGSERPARFVILRHRGGGSKTLGLVGKGVTFDSGGLSLKSSEHMIDMKCDMAGAAAVLCGMQAIAALKVPANVSGYIPLVENMPSGKALKLGDVLRARNGKTIEIHNTDAEGRLILADALAYAVDDKVDHLVDFATLTGSCVVALGPDVAGAMSNDDHWTRRVLAAAERAGERVWPLPMYPFYSEMIKSHVADIKNTGGSRYAGAISAAKFLEEFVDNVPWVHLDIAGPAFCGDDGAARDAGGTGCFVRTIVELAADYAGSANQ